MRTERGFTLIAILMVIVVVTAIAGTSYLANLEKPPSITPNENPAMSPQPTSSVSPSPSSTPTLSSTSQPTSSPSKTTIVSLNQSFSMKAGDEVEISNTNLKIKITTITVPSEGTYDMPNKVLGQATYQGQTESFSFTLGGNQTAEMANLRRQQNVFNLFNIYVQQVTGNEVTLIVKKI
ncbi:hypothetical protein HYS94_01115 [Candidatus Daviesbacteria bacterium]|nr:hypothetical protein [Candidatus Daviesbacteria bacterium]